MLQSRARESHGELDRSIKSAVRLMNSLESALVLIVGVLCRQSLARESHGGLGRSTKIAVHLMDSLLNQ